MTILNIGINPVLDEIEIKIVNDEIHLKKYKEKTTGNLYTLQQDVYFTIFKSLSQYILRVTGMMFVDAIFAAVCKSQNPFRTSCLIMS